MNEQHLYSFLFYRKNASGQVVQDTACATTHSLVEAMEICGVLPSMLITVWRDGEEL